ncbi:hypothetical protein NHX12_033715 [Muraenolepis orangiensis]|uniref:Uncharacterized protein n=1 Tax=Muraenolepis orangiensis TaxID=630683 RepID=A0A9Q0E480_9TELE|nr:hypothetical protein NHX12_033715 [Muraenolepis orangiensis]
MKLFPYGRSAEAGLTRDLNPASTDPCQGPAASGRSPPDRQTTNNKCMHHCVVLFFRPLPPLVPGGGPYNMLRVTRRRRASVRRGTPDPTPGGTDGRSGAEVTAQSHGGPRQ